MTKERILMEIAHNELLLKFTMRAAKNPPQSFSDMMLNQAMRIEAKIKELKTMLKPKKVKQKQTVRRKK